jgi:serine/threonine protein kinase
LHRLHTEIIALKEADHPNITKVHEVFYEFPEVYMIMDLCRGGNVRERIESHEGGLPEGDAAGHIRYSINQLLECLLCQLYDDLPH